MNKVLTTVLLIFTLMSTEVNMALRSAATGNRPAPRTATAGGGNTNGSGGGTVWGNSGSGGTVVNQTSPYNYATNPIFQNNPATPNIQAGTPGTPAWLKKLRESEPGAQPYNYGSSPMFQNNPATPNTPSATTMPKVPAWLQTLRSNAQGSGAFNYGNRTAVQNNQAVFPNAPTIPSAYGGTNPNPEVTQGTLRGTNQPFVVGQDAITQSPTSPYDSYGGVRFPELNLTPVNPRTIVAGPGTLDPSLWNPAEGGGFGSSYGGNWKKRGGGGGGGGWSGGGSYNDYPAWVKTLMGLNSWNIK